MDPEREKQTIDVVGSQSTAVVPINKSFRALANVSGLKELVAANLGQRECSLFDLERMKMPPGEAPGLFMVTDEVVGDHTVESFEGIVVFYKDARAYWEKTFDETGGGNPPDCDSDDLHTGHGNIGDGKTERSCRGCPMNEWGSAKKGNKRGKACRQMVVLFVLRTDKNQALFPSVVVAGPGSLKSINRYFLGLTDRGIAYYKAMHRFSLKKETNADGIKYWSLDMKLARELNEEETTAARGYSASMESSFLAVKPTRDMVDGASAEGPEDVEL